MLYLLLQCLTMVVRLFVELSLSIRTVISILNILRYLIMESGDGLRQQIRYSWVLFIIKKQKKIRKYSIFYINPILITKLILFL